MIATLVSSSSFKTFLLASLLLAIAPGPGVMYLLTRTLSLGRAAGLASVGGVAIGNLANAALASLGLAALMAASAALSRSSNSWARPTSYSWRYRHCAPSPMRRAGPARLERPRRSGQWRTSVT
jgi:hypothetical protein